MSAPREYSWRTEASEIATLWKDEIKGKTIVITGVSLNSLGAETIRVLAPYAKTIVAASRRPAVVEEAIAPARAESPKADIRVVALDLADEDSIRTAAKEILAFEIPINVLFVNAAVPIFDTLTRTKQGYEAQFGANHLGHFLFTSLLFPAIRKGVLPSTPARIVTVSSIAVTFGGDIRWDDIDYTKRPEEYSKYACYSRSKLANVLFAKGITQKYQKEGIVGFSLHPGAIWTTTIGGSMPTEDLIAFGLMNEKGEPAYEGVSKTIPQGTSTQIAAAFDPTILDQAGAYLDDCVPHNDRLPKEANDEDALRLWAVSEQILGVKFGQSA